MLACVLELTHFTLKNSFERIYKLSIKCGEFLCIVILKKKKVFVLVLLRLRFTAPALCRKILAQGHTEAAARRTGQPEVDHGF